MRRTQQHLPSFYAGRLSPAARNTDPCEDGGAQPSGSWRVQRGAPATGQHHRSACDVLLLRASCHAGSRGDVRTHSDEWGDRNNVAYWLGLRHTCSNTNDHHTHAPCYTQLERRLRRGNCALVALGLGCAITSHAGEDQGAVASQYKQCRVRNALGVQDGTPCGLHHGAGERHKQDSFRQHRGPQDELGGDGVPNEEHLRDSTRRGRTHVQYHAPGGDVEPHGGGHQEPHAEHSKEQGRFGATGPRHGTHTQPVRAHRQQAPHPHDAELLGDELCQWVTVAVVLHRATRGVARCCVCLSGTQRVVEGMTTVGLCIHLVALRTSSHNPKLTSGSTSPPPTHAPYQPFTPSFTDVSLFPHTYRRLTHDGEEAKGRRGGGGGRHVAMGEGHECPRASLWRDVDRGPQHRPPAVGRHHAWARWLPFREIPRHPPLVGCVCGEGGAAYLWNVKVPPGTPFTDFGNKAKAHSIILSNRRVVPDHVYASCITLRTQEITCGTTTTPSDARRRAASCAPRLRNSQQQHCFVCSGKHLALSNTFLSRTQTRYTTTKTTIQDSARGSAPCTSSSSSSTTEDGSNSPALMIALACSMLS